MKKTSKILLILCIALTSLVFLSNVKASAIVEYPVYKSSDEFEYYHNILLWKGAALGGSDEDDVLPLTTYVLKDGFVDNVTNDKIEVWNKEDHTDTKTIEKTDLCAGFMAIGEKELNFSLDDILDSGHKSFENLTMDGLKKIVYIDGKLEESDPVIKDLIKNAEKNTTFLIREIYSDLVIPEGVKVLFRQYYGKEIVVNGKVLSTDLNLGKVSGSGNILVDFDAYNYIGDGIENGTPLQSTAMAIFDELKDVKIDIKKSNLKDGDALFWFYGKNKDEAQKMVDMLNNCKGETLKDYEFELKVHEFSTEELKNSGYEGEDIEYNKINYYASIKKTGTPKEETPKTENTTTTKNVENPKTGDNVFSNFIIVSLAFICLSLICLSSCRLYVINRKKHN